MDPNSSLKKICLGDDVIVISSDKVEGSGDWNSLKYQDIAGSKGNKVMNELGFYKMETDEETFDENLISNEYAVKLCLDYEDQLLDFDFDDAPKFGEELHLLVSSDHLTQEEAAKEALAIRINQKFALLEEVRLVIETMA
nr:hypothetical protein [Tanacetum cinerariifolium]